MKAKEKSILHMLCQIVPKNTSRLEWSENKEYLYIFKKYLNVVVTVIRSWIFLNINFVQNGKKF